MSEVKTEETNVVEKIGFFKRTWKTVVTGVVCAVVGAGVTIGADVAKVQDTLNKSQVNQVAIASATYAAEQIIAKLPAIATADKKAAIVKDVIAQVQASIPTFIEAATAVKEAAKDVKADVTSVKTDVKAVATEVKKEAKDAAATLNKEVKSVESK